LELGEGGGGGGDSAGLDLGEIAGGAGGGVGQKGLHRRVVGGRGAQRNAPGACVGEAGRVLCAAELRGPVNWPTTNATP
jgi:hypothetical protein